MLRTHSRPGTWRWTCISSIEGNAFVPGYKVGLNWLIPPDVTDTVTSVDGVISTGGKNKFRERECHHMYGEGELYFIGGNNYASSTIFPLNTSWAVERNSFKYSSNTPAYNVGPTFTGDTFTYHRTFPDRTWLGTQTRNAVYDVKPGKSPDNVSCLVMTASWEVKQTSGWNCQTMTSYTQLNSATRKYRVYYGPSWSKWFNADYLYYNVSSGQRGLITIPRDWNHLAIMLNRVIFPDDMGVYGELARRCADDAKSIDINSLEYLRDLSHLVSDGKDLYSLLKGKVSLKSIADLYLSLKYGYRLTYADTITLKEDVDFLLRKPSVPFSWVRAAESTSMQVGSIVCNSSYHYKVFYEQHSQEFLKGIADLQSAGLFPSPKTVWELIPFTFVVDWFTDLSNRIDELDAQLFWSTHRVLGTTMSVKRSYGQIPLSMIGLSGYAGEFVFHTYQRMTPPSLLLPQYFSDAPREFHNYVDLAALILQRKKK